MTYSHNIVQVPEPNDIGYVIEIRSQVNGRILFQPLAERRTLNIAAIALTVFEPVLD